MVGTLVGRIFARHAVADGPPCRLPDEMTGGGPAGARHRDAAMHQREYAAEETPVSARGVIRSDAVHILGRYGTAYALLDERTADYDCALKSDVFRLADWVGEYVEVTGPLTVREEGMPTMLVTRLQLLATKWMR